jgi:hypothetical protein
MPDDQNRPSLLGGLLPRVAPEPPAPEAPPPPSAIGSSFQIALNDIGQEYAAIAGALAQATPETFQDVMNAIGPRIEPMMAACATAISERLSAVATIHPYIAEALSALTLRVEIMRWTTILSLDAVALCPAVAQARAAEEAEEVDDEDDGNE